MSIRAWVSLSLAAAMGLSAFACGPKAGGDRLPGARGIQDASQKMFDFLCVCEESDGDSCEDPDGDPGYFGDVDTACIDRVLAAFPADRAIAQCQVDALYDLVECYEATGCPRGTVVSSPPSDGSTQTPGQPEPTEDPDPSDGCEDEFSRAVEDDCGEIGDDALLRLEQECDIGGDEECVAVSENGETTDCSRDNGQSSPSCNPDVESCGAAD